MGIRIALRRSAPWAGDQCYASGIFEAFPVHASKWSARPRAKRPRRLRADSQPAREAPRQARLQASTDRRAAAPVLVPRASRDPHPEPPRGAHRLSPAQQDFRVSRRGDRALAQPPFEFRVGRWLPCTARCADLCDGVAPVPRLTAHPLDLHEGASAVASRGVQDPQPEWPREDAPFAANGEESRQREDLRPRARATHARSPRQRGLALTAQARLRDAARAGVPRSRGCHPAEAFLHARTTSAGCAAPAPPSWEPTEQSEVAAVTPPACQV